MRDDLWARVDALARRRNISPDDVIQAALVQLFSRKKASSGSGATHMPPSPTSAPTSSLGQAPLAPPRHPPLGQAPLGSSPLSPPSSLGPAPMSSRPSLTPPGGSAGFPRSPSAGSRLPAPSMSRAAPPQAQVGRPLYLCYDGQWYAIDQDEFVIGRGSKYSDLAIKDANISRRHVAIVRRNGEYYMKDLGSTNGVEFHGQRVDNHHIEEGSVYRMCDHEIRFSFEPPV